METQECLISSLFACRSGSKNVFYTHVRLGVFAFLVPHAAALRSPYTTFDIKKSKSFLSSALYQTNIRCYLLSEVPLVTSFDPSMLLQNPSQGGQKVADVFSRRSAGSWGAGSWIERMGFNVGNC